ncbi:starch synthase [Alpinimonas psychrophila]|uniref:D-inositol 3-phosphate glycosyltransferase n=1 Tax=Alpinimonas psychrophila TaxID=748908 RepID=A0A7W3JSI0_9MICO|nr:starch synthase [Alpinimonas psychrophila]
MTVRCFGADRTEADVFAYRVPAELTSANSALATLGVDLQMANDVVGADVVHSHTWYANEAGRLAQLVHGIPHVITAHSLEPLRPWKAEQLGGGYRLSGFIEKSAYEAADAVIAVSEGMRQDILRCYPAIDPAKVHTIHNGIDCEAWRPTENAGVFERYDIDPTRPSVVFVGRITRQKGLPYLLEAVQTLPADVQIILCAGAADTPEILTEVEAKVATLRQTRSGVIWISEHLPRHELSAVLTQGTIFVCPSIYEPLGIVNLEAMACGIPVVGTATGGIPEVIEDGVTGWLVPLEQVTDGTGTPLYPQTFIKDLSATLNHALADPARAAEMGRAARQRAKDHFDWARIATQTRAVYDIVCTR